MKQLPVLIVIDVQDGFLDPAWGNSTNPKCEENIGALLDLWRAKEGPIVLVRHDSVNPNSKLAPGSPGNALQSGILGKHDLLISKSVNSAFYGTPDLHEWLQSHDYQDVVIFGITTNHCCETTARMAGNLGYQVTFVLDATRAYDMTDVNGEVICADDVMRMTGANLNGEFATVVDTKYVLESFA
jgi:nicotinamidase-related amidase